MTAIPCGASTFQLIPGPDLSAAPGGTLSWSLSISNDNTLSFLQIDNAVWYVTLDATEGSGDNFASFPFPILAPENGGSPTVEIVSFFSVTWLPTATGGYGAGGNFVISSSFCADDQQNGCIANPDVSLPSSASVENVTAAVPEPASALLFAIGVFGFYLVCSWRKSQARAKLHSR
jgi:hypothetical protein